MKDGGAFTFETIAKRETVEGWVCQKCRRFYAEDERMARFCCTRQTPCGQDGCTSLSEKAMVYCKTHCDENTKAREDEKWAKREFRDWDGVQMLYSDTHDKYFSDPSEAEEYADEEGVTVAELRLILCDQNKARAFSAEDLYADYETEDGEGVPDTTELEKIVNEWTAAHPPTTWGPGKYALKLAEPAQHEREA